MQKAELGSQVVFRQSVPDSKHAGNGAVNPQRITPEITTKYVDLHA